MANLATPLLQLVEQITGENPDGIWGDTLNLGFMDLVDDAMAGRSDISVTTMGQSLTDFPGAPNESRAMMLVITGTPGVPREVVVPARQKLYLVKNESDGDAVIKTLNSVGVTVVPGDLVALYVDQTLDAVIQIGSVGGAFEQGSVFQSPAQPGTIIGSTAGAQFPGVITATQGNMVTAQVPIDPGPAGVTVAETSYRWVKTNFPGGTPDGSQYSPSPSLDHCYTIAIAEDDGIITIFHDCYVCFFADGLSIEFFKCSGAAWISGTVRFISQNHKPLFTTYPRV